MSFVCQNCEEAQSSKTTPNRFVYQIRNVKYVPFLIKQNRAIPHPQIKPSFGKEIVKEAFLCDACYELVRESVPHEVGMRVIEYFPPIKERKFFEGNENQDN